MATIHDSTTGDATDVVAAEELVGLGVIGRDGERIGTIREVVLDQDDRIVMLHVRERWMLGATHDVPAADMRLVDTLVYVPTTRQAVLDREQVARAAEPASAAAATTATTAVGRSTTPVRGGGVDLASSLVGALVTVASLVLIGGLLAALFDVQPTVIDTGSDTFALVTSGTVLVGFATLFLSFLVGGWATGRGSRFDGVADALVMVVWVLGLGVVLGALGAWANDRYDVYVNASLPSFQTDHFAVWGGIAFVVAFALMLGGAVLGGALGDRSRR